MRHFRQWAMIALLSACALCGVVISAQEGEALDLPADLFVLLNDGAIFRYGVGAAGVSQVTPPGEFAADFGVDDRAARLAYRTEAGLFTIDLSAPGAAPVQIEGASAGLPAYRGGKQTIAFSPGATEVPGTALAYTTLDGLRIAFVNDGAAPTFQAFTDAVFTDLSWSPTGRYLAAETIENVWFIYRRDTAQLTLTSIIVSSFGTAWVSPGEIVFAPSEGGLKIMNLDAANQQTDLLEPSVEYRYPYLTSDDNLDFFARAKNDAAVPPGYGILLRLARGAQVVETVGSTPIELTDLRWVPGGSLMTAFQGGVLAVFDPASGFGYPLPIENVVAYDWGSAGAAGTARRAIRLERAIRAGSGEYAARAEYHAAASGDGGGYEPARRLVFYRPGRFRRRAGLASEHGCDRADTADLCRYRCERIHRRG